MSPGPKRRERDRAPVARACGSRARARRARRSRCRSRRPRGTRPGPARSCAAPRTAAIRSRSSRSSVENTGTRPSSSTTSAERVARHRRRNITRHAAPRRGADSGRRRYLQSRCPSASQRDDAARARLRSSLALRGRARRARGARDRTGAASPSARTRRAARSCARANCGRRSTSATRPTSPTRSACAARCPATATPHDTMYMRFRLQYLNTTSKAWIDLASARPPDFVAVGAGSHRAPGRAQLPARPPSPASPRSRCAASSSFQWRHGETVLVADLAPDERRRTEPRRRRPRRVHRRHLPDRLSARARQARRRVSRVPSQNSRGSLVMIPSTPIAVSLAIRARRRPSTRTARRRLRAPRARARGVTTRQCAMIASKRPSRSACARAAAAASRGSR